MALKNNISKAAEVFVEIPVGGWKSEYKRRYKNAIKKLVTGISVQKIDVESTTTAEGVNIEVFFDLLDNYTLNNKDIIKAVKFCYSDDGGMIDIYFECMSVCDDNSLMTLNCELPDFLIEECLYFLESNDINCTISTPNIGFDLREELEISLADYWFDRESLATL